MPKLLPEVFVSNASCPSVQGGEAGGVAQAGQPGIFPNLEVICVYPIVC